LFYSIKLNNHLWIQYKIYFLKTEKTNIKVSDFSTHLFWDIDRTKLDFEKNKQTIIQKVLDYGLINDWKIIYNYYGIDEIANTMLNVRDLDEMSMNFIATLSNIPKEKFLCYTTKQLNRQHWVS